MKQSLGFLRWCYVLNPYKPSVLFVLRTQIVQTNTRRRRTRGLIRVSTVCLQNVLLKFEYKWKIPPNIPYSRTWLFQLITVGNSIRLKRYVPPTFLVLILVQHLINVNAVEKIYPICVLVLNGLILYIVYRLQIYYGPKNSTCCHRRSYRTNALFRHCILCLQWLRNRKRSPR